LYGEGEVSGPIFSGLPIPLKSWCKKLSLVTSLSRNKFQTIKAEFPQSQVCGDMDSPWDLMVGVVKPVLSFQSSPHTSPQQTQELSKLLCEVAKIRLEFHTLQGDSAKFVLRCYLPCYVSISDGVNAISSEPPRKRVVALMA